MLTIDELRERQRERFEREREDASRFAGSMTLLVSELCGAVGSELQMGQFESAEAFVIGLSGHIGEDFASRGGMTARRECCAPGPSHRRRPS